MILYTFVEILTDLLISIGFLIFLLIFMGVVMSGFTND